MASDVAEICILDLGLEPNQLVAASKLAEGRTRKDAAIAADCGERTIYEWLKKPEFKKAISLLVPEDRLRQRRSAFTTAEQLANDESQSPDVRLRAAAILLQYTGSEDASDTPAAATSLVNLVISKSRGVDDADPDTDPEA